MLMYEVTNNFETYTTAEIPSQEYKSSYIAHCMIELNMPLSAVKFECKPHTVFMRNRRVGSYERK